MTTTDRPTPEGPAGVVGTDAAPTDPATHRGYWSLWRSVPRELGFLILTMPIAITGLVVLVTLFFTGVGLVFLFVGILLVVAALFAARGFGTLELVRLRWAGRRPIRRPVWEPRDRPLGFWRRVFAPFVDGHYWLYLLHGGVVNPIVSVFSWSVTIAWVSGAIGGTTGWSWQGFIPGEERDFWLHRMLEAVVPGVVSGIDPVVLENGFEFVAGLVFLATLPLVFRGLVLLHDVIARGILGSWRSEALEAEVQQLATSRSAAVEAEDLALRRLERDIHDGPQQRLVRLQMDLAAIERRLDAGDEESARGLLGEARDQTAEALDELRALSRGFAPPILQDRGLVAGLESLAARSPIPVTFEDRVPTDAGLPSSLERNAYFIAAELLTNAAKHSGASAVRLVVATRAESGSRWLDLWVTDNGRGGAVALEGHGLAGLDERVRGLRGVLAVDSPVGGPTIVGAHLPY